MFLIKRAERYFIKDFFFCFLISVCLAVIGRVRIPLFFTPVPIVFQLQAIFFITAVLGKRRAFLSTLFLLVQGIFFPVFSSGLLLFGMTFGYLIGYLLSTLVVGGKTSFELFFKITMATFLVYFLGTFHLSFFLGIKKAVVLGALPFLIPDILKNLSLVYLLKRFRAIG